MTTVFRGREEGGLGVFSSLGDAKVGRWAKTPGIPDRCGFCWDPDTMLHRVAVAYWEDDEGWRDGLCERCATGESEEIRKWGPEQFNADDVVWRKPENETKVIFRKWKSNSDIIALFPEEPTTLSGTECDSYMHVGQHGAADYHSVIARTTPATKEEYRDLQIELERIGYNLDIRRRASPEMHNRRFRLVKSRREKATI